MDAQQAFVRRELIAPLEPPRVSTGVPGWMRQRLFDGISNTVLTAVSFALLIAVLWPTLRFLLIDAVWDGSSRVDCLPETAGRPVGACWPFVAAKFDQLMYGFYPQAEHWRVNLTYVLGAILLAPLLVPRLPHKAVNAILFFGLFPIVAFFLLVGDVLGLPHVETRVWGGLLVTLVIAFTGIIGSLPLGILLALGRRSELPLIRGLSIVFIEFWRGVPLITVLFFATYMLPLFLPGNWKIDALARVLVGVVLFAAAYMAEVVRGGLQAIPRSQFEAAQALGLGYWRMMAFVILPQARHSGYRQFFHCAVQGYDIGADCRHLRPARTIAGGFLGPQLGDAEHAVYRLRLCRHDLFCVLLCDVALCIVCRAAAEYRGNALASSWTAMRKIR
jgi:general L-amino acid transport system permease protein